MEVKLAILAVLEGHRSVNEDLVLKSGRGMLPAADPTEWYENTWVKRR